jgi:DNA polymerase I-like protein with 3'-5' exonuclease and polymerase domains
MTMTDLFGDEVRTAKRRGVIIRDLPPVPNTGWRPPEHPPNLDAAVILGADVETYDPELLTAGPGWARHRGEICGVSIAAEDRLGNVGSWYFPMRHRVEPEDNIDPAKCMPWIAEQMRRPIPKVGANFMYDMGWLAEEGAPVSGPVHDIQFAEAIIDNNARVSLERLSNKYLGHGKIDEELKNWILAAYKTKPVTAWRKDIYRSPPRLVGPYAEGDAWEPLAIIKKQWQTIARENMGAVYDLEHGLLPMLVGMRMGGVRVDVERAHMIADELKDLIEAEYLAIGKDYGMALESTDSRQLAKLLDTIGITYPRTKADGPSIQKPWLDALEHPIGGRLNNLREMEKMKGTFLESYIIDKQVDGKVFPQFHPLRGENNGTMLGRFASSDPNLQNIPSRTDLGARMRTCFIPFDGHVGWHKKDFSQLHYRILADLAVDAGDGSADLLRQSYIDDPHMDYHMKVYQAAAPLLHWPTNYVFNADGKIIADDQPKEIKVKRRPIKNVNFGLIYGQGEMSLAYKAGFNKSDAGTFFGAYHAAAPYVKPTMQAIAFEAQINSYVTTLLGRRIRFDRYEPIERKLGKNAEEIIPLPYEMAVAKWGSMVRLAFLYRAVNYKIQGTEPDIMKSAMLACYRSGVFDVTGLPMITVHDELNWSKRENSRLQDEAFAYINHTMETTTRLRVPLIVDAKEGTNWGTLE